MQKTKQNVQFVFKPSWFLDLSLFLFCVQETKNYHNKIYGEMDVYKQTYCDQ
jgi:hypothetical protein